MANGHFLSRYDNERRPGEVCRWELVTLALIVVVGIGLRVGHLVEVEQDTVLYFPHTVKSFNDDFFVDDWARNLVYAVVGEKALNDPATREAVQRGGQPAKFFYLRPPAYPFFLAAVYLTSGCHYLAVRLIQMGLGVLSILLAYTLARALSGRTTALVAAAFMAVHWMFILYEPEYQSTTLQVFLFLAIANLGHMWRSSRHPAWAIALGVTTGVLAQTTNVGPVPVVATLAWMIWAVWRARLGRVGWASVVACGTGVLLVLAPVFVRNAREVGERVRLAPALSLNLYLGNNERAEGVISVPPGFWPFPTVYYAPFHMRRLSAELGRPARFEDLTSYCMTRVMQFGREHPGRLIALTVKRALLFWGPKEIPHNLFEVFIREQSPLLRWLPFSFATILAMAVGGLLLSAIGAVPNHTPQFRRGTGAGGLILLLVTLYWLAYVPFFVSAMYRVPIVPFLMIAGAIGVVGTVDAARARRWRLAAAALTLMLVVRGGFALVPVDYGQDLMRWHAQIYMANGDFEQASRLAQAMARSLIARGEISGDALSLVKPELDRRDIAHLRTMAGLWYFQDFQLAKAEAELAQALAIAPGDVWAEQCLQMVRAAPPNYAQYVSDAQVKRPGVSAGTAGGSW